MEKHVNQGAITPKEEIRPLAFRIEALEDRLAPSGGCGCGCDLLDANLTLNASVNTCGISVNACVSASI